MKKLLGILVLGLLWCNVGFADDISEFKIEGISIGDSLLVHLSKEEIENECVELLEEIRSVFKNPWLLNIQQLDKNVRTLITKECVKSFIEEANFKRKNNQEFQNIFIKYKDIKMHINLTSSSNIGISINILKDSILEFSYPGEDYDLILKIEKRNQGDLSR